MFKLVLNSFFKMNETNASDVHLHKFTTRGQHSDLTARARAAMFVRLWSRGQFELIQAFCILGAETTHVLAMC